MLDSSQSGATAGTPAFFYVYILRSISHPEQIYTGFTESIPGRLDHHKWGHSPHTKRYRPWKLETYFAFSDRQLALDFERYLKSGSGRAFLHKRLIHSETQ